MNSPRERFARVERLFREACGMSSEERERFLDSSSEEDTVCEQVRSMLRIDESTRGVLDAPAYGVGWSDSNLSSSCDAESDTLLPDFIGHYRPVRVLGQGGMGIVYEAEQENPRRRVALKMLRRQWGSEQLLRRFRRESEILGRLQHPGIAQILEAGSAEDDGSLPFIAMEFVQGRPLLEYAREKNLSRRDRLELMAKICDAVHYAHQNGVVHRDLKPANILVVQGEPPSAATRTGEPLCQPKILDFGVSSLTDPTLPAVTMHTSVGELIGTVPYMSPEQAGGDPDNVDRRSDVYSLGVILYELLTGRLPQDVRHMMVHEAVRAIQEDEPTRAGSVDRSLRGDIETILAKALEKDKSRRYQSAADLGADLRRHLDQHPIIARPASTMYRVQKFSKRNKAIVTGVGIAFVAMACATALSVHQAIKLDRALQQESEQRTLAEQKTAEAELAQEQAEAANQFLAEMIGSSDPDDLGKDVRISDVLEYATTQIEPRFPDQPGVRAHLRRNIGISFRQLGMLDEAETQLVEAAKDAKLAHGENHRDTLRAIRSLAVLYDDQGKYDKSLPMHREILTIQQRTLGPLHRDTLGSACNVGLTLYDLDHYEEAGEILEDTVVAMRRTMGMEDRFTINAIQGLGSVRLSQGRLTDAESAFAEALGASTRAFGPNDLRAISALYSLAEVEHARDNAAVAIAYLDDAMARATDALPTDHWRIGRILHLRGLCLIKQERFDEAENHLLDAHKMFEATFGSGEGTMTSDARSALTHLQQVREKVGQTAPD